MIHTSASDLYYTIQKADRNITKNILSKRHALIFEHKITLMIEKWQIFRLKKMKSVILFVL